MSTYDLSTTPRENFIHESRVLQQVLQDLAPAILDQAALYTLLKAYIFPTPFASQPDRTAVAAALQAAAIPAEVLDTLLTILDGAQVFQEMHHVYAPNEFDHRMQLRQQETLHWIEQDQLASSAKNCTLRKLTYSLHKP